VRSISTRTDAGKEADSGGPRKKRVNIGQKKSLNKIRPKKTKFVVEALKNGGEFRGRSFRTDFVTKCVPVHTPPRQNQLGLAMRRVFKMCQKLRILETDLRFQDKERQRSDFGHERSSGARLGRHGPELGEEAVHGELVDVGGRGRWPGRRGKKVSGKTKSSCECHW